MGNRVIRSFSLSPDVARLLDAIPSQARSRTVNDILRQALSSSAGVSPQIPRKELPKELSADQVQQVRRIIREVLRGLGDGDEPAAPDTSGVSRPMNTTDSEARVSAGLDAILKAANGE